MLKNILTATEHEALPDALKEYYKADGANFSLLHDGGDRIHEFRESNIALTNANKDLSGKVDALTANVTKITETLAASAGAEEDAEKAKMLKDGDVAGLLEKQKEEIRAEVNGQITSLQDTLKSTQAELHSVKITDELRKSGIEAGVNKDLLDMAVKTAETEFKLSDKGPVREVNGEIVPSAQRPGEVQNFSEYWEETLKTMPALAAPSGGGGGLHNPNPGQHKGVVDASDPLALGQAADDIVAGKVIVRE